MAESIQIAMQHHQAGRLAEAEKIYREILAQRPNDPAALHLLGMLAGQVGRLDAAIELIGRAVRLDPNYAEAYGTLGNVLQARGQLDEAIASYRQTLRLKPDLAAAHNNLGSALQAKGELDEAISSYRHAIALKPDLPEAHSNLGNALREKERFAEAIACYHEAIRLKPDYAEAHTNLGNSLKAIGQVDDAVASYRQAIRFKPESAEMHSNLGNLLKDTARYGEAIACHREAIRLKPDLADLHNNLGSALKDSGRVEDAIISYRQAIRLRPDYALAASNLGSALNDTGQSDEAIAALRQALRLEPELASAHNNLGNALKAVGQCDEAVAAYRRAIELDPHFAQWHSNLIYGLQFRSGGDDGVIQEESRRWNERHAEPLGKFILPHTNDRDPDRRLRIGYVSADFRQHSVSRFLLPLFRRHDHAACEIVCYSDVVKSDAMTESLRACADGWENIAGWSDERVAEKVRGDKIDILIDLAGHTAGNRLRVFARKPAPVQISYLGYPRSTGLAVMDYRLSDPLADPPGTMEPLHGEKLLRLPVCNWCYGEPESAPAVQPLPASAGKAICFGTFNNFAKASPAIMDLWAAILTKIPSSRLIMKSLGLTGESVRGRINEWFASRGISADRLDIRGRLPDVASHFEAYNEMDIALDTFPYDGTTTTCEALWMGVPVVTLAGGTHVSRVGVSLLSCVGLPELIAQSAEEYVSIAVGLAKDLPRLSELRRTLRSRMRQSPLMDAGRFARDIEAAYRQAWRNWCAGGAE